MKSEKLPRHWYKVSYPFTRNRWVRCDGPYIEQHDFGFAAYTTERHNWVTFGQALQDVESHHLYTKCGCTPEMILANEIQQVEEEEDVT